MMLSKSLKYIKLNKGTIDNPIKVVPNKDACITPIPSTTYSDMEEPVNDPIIVIPSEIEIDELLEEEGSIGDSTDLLEVSAELCTQDLIGRLLHNPAETEQQEKENELCHHLKGHSSCTEVFIKKIWKTEVENFKNVLEKDVIQLSDVKRYYEHNFQYLTSTEYI